MMYYLASSTADQLVGQAGNDLLDGGAGNDTLIGGPKGMTPISLAMAMVMTPLPLIASQQAAVIMMSCALRVASVPRMWSYFYQPLFVFFCGNLRH